MELLRVPVSLALTDSKRHLHFPFTCPQGVSELRLDWRFSPAGAGELRTLITLSLTGPDVSGPDVNSPDIDGTGGFRGAGHRHGDHQEVQVGESGATPGYLPGPVTAGEWTVTLHTHLVMGQTEGELVVTGLGTASGSQFSAGEGQSPAEPEPVRPAPTSRNPATASWNGWMMGDLHCHTQHSDGRWTPPELARAAADRGLSFLALTDHNTVSGRGELARHFPGLTLPGLELTTFHGHAVVVGVPEYLDWTRLQRGAGMREVARRVAGQGGQLTIAHPFAVGDPICTGCAWTTFDLRPENASHVEVWNGTWAGRHNEQALAYWYGLLAAGRRVTATAGTDAHGPAYLSGVAFTCTPTTADPQALLAQLRAGETYLSGAATLTPSFLAPDGPVRLGGEGRAGTWEMKLGWADLPGSSVLTFVVDGERRVEPLASEGSLTRSFEVGKWLNIEIRSAGGDLLALSNPVYARQRG